MYTWRVLGPLNAERIWSHSPILILKFLKLHLSEIDKKNISIILDMSTIMLLVSLCLWNQTSKSKKTAWWIHQQRAWNSSAWQRFPQITVSSNETIHTEILSDPLRYLEISWDPFRSFQCFSSHPRTNGFYGCRMVLHGTTVLRPHYGRLVCIEHLSLKTR